MKQAIVNMWQPEDLENVTCKFCGGGRTQEVITRPDGMKVVECQNCGLCYLNPRPKENKIYKLYESDYFTKTSAPGLADIGYGSYFSEETRQTLIRVAKEKYEVVCRYVDLREARCLEIGCASGEFCQLLHSRGAKVLGMDLSAHAIEQAKTRYPGIDFEAGTVESRQSKEKFNVIFAFEVIEHVADPINFLESISKQLLPGGTLILTTPNYACGKKLGVNAWSGFLSSFEHLYFFSPEILLRMATKAGFTPVDWLTDKSDGSLPTAATMRENKFKLMVKGVLQQMHLLDAVKSLKKIIKQPPEMYSSNGEGHNLLVVLRKG